MEREKTIGDLLTELDVSLDNVDEQRKEVIDGVNVHKSYFSDLRKIKDSLAKLRDEIDKQIDEVDNLIADWSFDFDNYLQDPLAELDNEIEEAKHTFVEVQDRFVKDYVVDL